MASTFSDLGIELMATGENAGTWGTKTNTNLQIVEKAIAGYVEKSIAGGAQTTTLSITDGDTTESTSVARHAVIKLTGTITGNQIVTVPDSIEKVYIVVNGTSGSFTVQFKTASGTGITFGASDKGTRLLFSDGTNIVDTATGGVGSYDLNGDSLILDEDQDTTITADTDDQIDIAIAGADDFRFTANTFTALSGSTIAAQALTATTITASGIVKTDDTTEATSTTDGSLQTDGGLSVAKDAVIGDDLKLLSDSSVLSFGADSDTTLTHTDGTGLTLNSANKLTFRDTGLTIGSNADGDLDIVSDGTAVDSINIESAGGITLDAGTAGSGIIYEDDGTEMARIHNSSSNVILETKVSDADFSIKGNDGGSTITALTFDMSDTGKATFSGNVVVTGDLTVSGDDITMGTNTAGNLLIADGTNFNSVAVGSLSEISTVANDDVFLAVDTSGGGLKKIARSAVVAGLATSGAISNVVEDTSPQLGGDLDVNSNGLVSTSNGNIALTPNGTGVVRVDGSNGIDMESGAISIKNSGAESYVRFYCESSNAHYTQLQAAPHSAYSGNVTVVLPASADTLVGRATTDTLTNKTLTTPVIAEIDSGSTITLDATTDIILDADGDNITMKAAGTTVLDFVLNGATDVTLDAPGDLKFDADGGDFNFLDGGTEILRISNSSSDVIIRPVVDAKDLIFQQRDGTEVARIEDNGTFNVVTDKLAINGTAVTSTAAELNILDGVTSTAAELNILDGVTSTAAELNILDGVTSTAAELNLLDGDTSVGSSITIADSDGVVVNDGGTMKTVPASDFKTLVGAAAGGFSIANLDIDGGTDIGEAIVDADLFIVDNGAGGTNRKVAASRLTTYINANANFASVGKAIAMAIVFG